MVRRGRVAASLALAVVFGVRLRAAELPLPAVPAPTFVVVFDLRMVEPGEITVTNEASGPVSFPVSAVDDDAVVCSMVRDDDAVPVKKLKGYLECAIGHRLAGRDFDGDRPTIDQRQKAATAIASSLADLRKSQSSRAISDRGANVVAVALQTVEWRQITRTVTTTMCPSAAANTTTSATVHVVTGRRPQFTITEAARRSQIETDVNALLTLAGKVVQAPPPPPPPPGCQAATTFAQTVSNSVVWASGHVVPLSVKRATVTLDAALPAAVPQVLEPTDGSAAAAVRAADEAIRLAAMRRQEAEDLRVLMACPVADPGRLDSLQQVVCALTMSSPSTATPVAAVEALSKMTTPRRATFLRWAVERTAGEARDKALVALAQIASPAPAAAVAGKEVKQTSKFVSGPLEHWSISADVFTTRKTPFKKDDSGTVVIDGTPPVFYVGVNFLLGDLPSSERSLVENIELKWIVQGSKSPLDSVGVGVGLRGNYAKRFGFDFDLLSPFVGWTWTVAQDASRDRVLQTRFGVSLNVNKALTWVK